MAARTVMRSGIRPGPHDAAWDQSAPHETSPCRESATSSNSWNGRSLRRHPSPLSTNTRWLTHWPRIAGAASVATGVSGSLVDDHFGEHVEGSVQTEVLMTPVE